MLRAANTGISAIIDAHGRITASLGLDKTGTLTGRVPGALPPTLAGLLGLWGPGILAGLTLGLGFGLGAYPGVVLKKLENNSEKRKLG